MENLEKQMINEITTAMDELSKKSATAHKVTVGLTNAFKSSAVAFKAASISAKLFVKDGGDLAKTIDTASKEFKELKKQAIEQKRAQEALSNAMRGTTGRTKDLISSVSQLAGAIGVQTIGFTKAFKAMVDYNKSMFNLSRTMGVMGRDMSSFETAFKNIKESSVLSQMEFAKFSNTLMRGRTAVAPTAQALENLSDMMVEAFGPNIEEATSQLQEFYGILDEFPGATESLIRISNLRKKGTEAANAEARQIARATLTILESQGASISAKEKFLDLTRTRTAEEDEFIKTEQTIKRLNAAVEDFGVTLAKALESTGIISLLEGFTKLLKKVDETNAAMLGLSVAVGAIGLKSAPLLKGLSVSAIKSLAGGGAIGGGIRAAQTVATASRGGALGGAAAQTVSTAARTGATRVALGTALGAGSAATGAGLLGSGLIAKGFEMMAKKFQGTSTEQGVSEGTASKQAMVKSISVATGSVVGGLLGSFLGPLGTAGGAAAGGAGGAAVGDLFTSGMRNQELSVKIDKLRAKMAEARNQKAARMEKILYRQMKAREQIIKYGNKEIEIMKESEQILSNNAKILTESYRLIGEESTKAFQMAAMAADKSMMSARKQVDLLAKDLQTTLGKQLSGDEKKEFGGGIDAAFEAGNLQEVSNIVDEITAKKRSQYLAEAENLKKLQAEQDKLTDKIKLEDDKNRKKQLEAESKTVSEQINKIKSLKSEELSLNKLKSDLMAKNNSLLEMEGNQFEKNKAAYMGDYAQRLKSLKAITQQVDKERKVNEAAMMGMGTDIRFLQKQINLEVERLKINQQAIKQQEKQMGLMAMQEGYLKKINGKTAALSKDEQNILKTKFKEAYLASRSQKTEEGRSKAAKEVLMTVKAETRGKIDVEKISGEITRHANEYNNLQTASLDAQLQIYELTKEIREGYLDAMRQMSFGAGEFEKIIGTQTYGTTQLMEAIDRVNNEFGSSNTMMRGGRTMAGGKSWKGRSKAPVTYTADTGVDVSGLSSADQNAILTDIPGYRTAAEDQRRYAAGQAPTAGFMGTSEHTNTAGAMAEASLRTSRAAYTGTAVSPEKRTPSSMEWQHKFNIDHAARTSQSSMRSQPATAPWKNPAQVAEVLPIVPSTVQTATIYIETSGDLKATVKNAEGAVKVIQKSTK